MKQRNTKVLAFAMAVMMTAGLASCGASDSSIGAGTADSHGTNSTVQTQVLAGNTTANSLNTTVKTDTDDTGSVKKPKLPAR